MPERNSWLLPVAIVLAGLGIGLAIFFVHRSAVAPVKADLSLIRPISTNDHIVGNPQAVVVVVEYSDIDCEFCKQFQESMEQIMTDYGTQGNVAWVFRHFPIIEAHQYAAQHAKAAECVALQGGNTLFFHFIDALHQKAPGAAQFDPKGYDTVVASLGLSSVEFEKCMQGGSDIEKRVGADYDNAIAIGAEGAPYSLILVKGSEPIPVSGALPYTALKKVIETALQKAQTVPTN